MQHQKQFIRRMAAVLITKAIDMNNKRNMKNCLALMVVLLAILLLSPTAAAQEKIRLIVDTDAMAEIDDQAAITYALFSGNHFEVEGITVNRGSDGPHRTDRDRDIDDHFNEAVTVARLCASSNVPVLKGPAGNYRSVKDHVHNPTFDGSDAVNFIIQRAHASSNHKLNIFADGNVTNIALALLKDPTIANRIVVWWMGTWHPADFADNNMAGDLDAAAALFANPQNVPLHIIPWNIPNMGTTWDEYRTKMRGRGPNISPAVSTRYGSYTRVGDYLAELFNRQVGARQKEHGRSILDVVGLSVVKNNVGQFTPDETGAPSINYQSETGSERHGAIPLTWSNNPGNPRRVTFWRNPNRDAVYNDFYNTMDNYVLPRQQPIKIIFDSDMGGDTDDGGCAAMLHALQNRGEVEVIACIFCTGTGAEYNEFGAGYWDAINHYYNRGDIPIGANKIPNENREGGAKAIYGFKDVEGIAKDTARYGHKIISSKECPSAIEVYRRALAEAEDGSITILTIGEVNVIPRLLDSPADKVSPLTGYELVARKCSRIVSMGPPYNWGIARLHDPLPDGGWGQQMLEKLPPNIPVYASPGGGQVRSGMSLYKTPVDNPVRENYRICNGGTIDSETDHHSMDACAAYFAVRGAQPGLQQLTSHGSWVPGEGFNSYNVWNSNIDNPMHLKVDVVSNADLGKVIDALMGELPVAISITSPRGGEVWEAGAKRDIKWTTEGDIPQVRIAYTTDGVAWKEIADSLDNTGSYTWTIPEDVSETVRLKVSAIPEAVMKGVSGQIEIKEPTDR